MCQKCRTLVRMSHIMLVENVIEVHPHSSVLLNKKCIGVDASFN